MTNVLLIYEVFIPSVKLCAYDQLNYLYERGKISFKHCLAKNVTKTMCERADIVVFARSASVLEEKLAMEFKKCGKLLIYSMDDDLLNVPEYISSGAYFRLKNVKNRISHIMQLCDFLVTPSPLLGQKYGGTFIRTFLMEEPCVVKPYSITTSNKKVKIGFAGSIDRAGDINNLISGALREVLHRYGDRVIIEFMGAEPDLVKEFKLTHFPYENSYKAYKDKLDQLNWDIGLAPLPDTLFHNCKHYNKYIEYSSSNIVGIYSNVQPYTRVIRNKINGMLCDNTEEAWVNAISWLIEHDEAREAIKEYNNKLMSDRYSIPVVAEQLFCEFQEFTSYHAKECTKFPLRKIKTISIIKKSYEFILKYGVRSPWIALIKCYNLLRNKG